MLAILLALLQAPNVAAPTAPAFDADLDPPGDPVGSVVRRTRLAGRPLAYRMTAGRLPILDNETGTVRARMFFVAYTVPSRGVRPVTFAWNGGPGSNAGLIQFGGLGPKRYAGGDTLVDNQETWLDRTDLVFVDPVGTGYSRATRAEFTAGFYQTQGDAEAMAEFIRTWLNREGRWRDPVYLAGESFGVTRAGRVAQIMARRRMPLKGVVLIGLTAPLARVPAPVREALSTVNYAAAAWHHHKLGAGLPADLSGVLAASTRFALDTLAPALAQTGGGADRDRLLRAAARYTAALPTAADTDAAVLPYPRFARILLAADGRRLGHYDTRRTAPMDRPDQPYDPNADPSLATPPPPDGVPRFLRTEMGYRNDLQYAGPFGGTWPPPASFRADWMSVKWHWEPGENSDTAGVGTAPPLRQAMEANPALRVLAVCGWYDLICTPAINDWVRAQLPPELQARVVTVGVSGGHAVYLDQEARATLKREAARLFTP